MSKRINVNPDHYKTAGRARQGEAIVHERQKAALSKTRERAEAGDRGAGKRPQRGIKRGGR